MPQHYSWCMKNFRKYFIMTLKLDRSSVDTNIVYRKLFMWEPESKIVFHYNQRVWARVVKHLHRLRGEQHKRACFMIKDKNRAPLCPQEFQWGKNQYRPLSERSGWKEAITVLTTKHSAQQWAGSHFEEKGSSERSLNSTPPTQMLPDTVYRPRWS